MHSRLTAGVDLGGTKLDIGLVDGSGKVVDQLLLPTRSREEPKAIVDDIVALISQLCEKRKEESVDSIGIGIAGQIDELNGIVRFAPNLGWHEYPLKKNLMDRLKKPVFVTNDVRAATWGEWLYGAGRGCQDFLCIFVGTGIGGGIVSNGNMLLGSSNCAGEIGHVTLDLHGPQCSCGNRGCFESLASGWAIAKRAKELAASHPESSLHDLIKNKEFSAKHVFQAYRSKDPLAKSIVTEVSEALIAGAASLVNAFNPKRVILGGGVIYGHPEFLQDIQRGLPKRALKAVIESLEIVQAELNVNAGVIGAAAYAKKVYHDKQ